MYSKPQRNMAYVHTYLGKLDTFPFITDIYLPLNLDLDSGGPIGMT